jgi:lysine 6-dehydrogenase
MKHKVVILGAGMVGRAMAIDLGRDHEVLSVDRDPAALDLLKNKAGIKTQIADLSQADVVTQVIAGADIVVGAVPGFMGFETLKTVIKAGKNIVDISFFPEDPFELDALAKKQGVIAIMDAGVAPGMSNLLLGYHNEHMQVSDFVCYVGGLPRERVWPYEYKAPFSPIDVIEEYTRTARYVEGGQVVEKPALSEPELIDFPGVGTLEAFNTDGLRSLIHTIKAPNMKEKTLRYPGHIEIMRILRETGFFREDEIVVKGKSVRPIDLTTSLLFPKWKLGETEEEFTLMQISVSGTENGVPKTYQYDLLDRYDAETQTSSMARTTGYTCTATTRLVLANRYRRTGIRPPEFVGAESGCLEFILGDLKKKNIHYCLTEK